MLQTLKLNIKKFENMKNNLVGMAPVSHLEVDWLNICYKNQFLSMSVIVALNS